MKCIGDARGWTRGVIQPATSATRSSNIRRECPAGVAPTGGSSMYLPAAYSHPRKMG